MLKLTMEARRTDLPAHPVLRAQGVHQGHSGQIAGAAPSCTLGLQQKQPSGAV